MLMHSQVFTNWARPHSLFRDHGGFTRLLAVVVVVAGFAAAACTNSDFAVGASEFALCSSAVDAVASTSSERRQQIMDQAQGAGIAGGGSLGDSGPVELELFVLDESSLETLAMIADPGEVCVSGQDPADYVEPGPQLESGPGWRWLGSARVAWKPALDPDLIEDSGELDLLWATMFPEDLASLPAVDFESESVLVLRTNNGTTPGPCGFRFEGISRAETGLVIAEMFSPGGSSACPTVWVNGTYAVAISHDVVGEPPFEFAVQYGPRLQPEAQGTIG